MSNILPPSESVLAELGINSEAIKLIQPHWKRTHYRAVVNWLTKYKPNPDANNLEKVRGYLEAFHHLCEVEAWEEADKILFTRLNTPTEQELHKQLGTWGYYREQTHLYLNILNKLSPRLNWIFLHSLGTTYYSLGKPTEAIKYYQQALKIAQEIPNHHWEIVSIEGLGMVYHHSLGNYEEAIKYYLKSLRLSSRILHRLGETTALSSLADTYSSKGDYTKAIDYYQQALRFAREIQQPRWEIAALGGLGDVYDRLLKDYEKAIDYRLQSLGRVINSTR
ncbi:tetratricopeptide repeat protein [Coleofasciculus sp. FACHB-542]|uniref:tetratricopeptide repeat protein n=1 Tax=Coleofasciculus sp. FACHB-542 TaxID=2692787 RepID=UPI0016888C0C|nr:tetratricopeptide repeat protein [Coleofasciculus sp. FACHB-542]MBD2085722.1 tetratricopeptide repeat protein [Coleofasciculus sp. FACHB-542]